MNNLRNLHASPHVHVVLLALLLALVLLLILGDTTPLNGLR
ncbi:MAG: hypothetical protein ACHQNA_11180 [Acidimicrobiales bacterium]